MSSIEGAEHAKSRRNLDMLATVSSIDCYDAASAAYMLEECVLMREGSETNSVGSGGTTMVAPEPTFNVEMQEPLHGKTAVNVTVSGASNVILSAYNKQLGEMFPLGAMSSASEILFRYYWDTTAFPDGEYKLSATIFNPSYPNGYTRSDSRYYEVDNIAEITSSGSSSTSSGTGVNTTTVAECPSILTEASPLYRFCVPSTAPNGFQHFDTKTYSWGICQACGMPGEIVIDGMPLCPSSILPENGKRLCKIGSTDTGYQEWRSSSLSWSTCNACHLNIQTVSSDDSHDLSLSFSKASPASGTVVVRSVTSGATGVKVYYRSSNATSNTFLGYAIYAGSDVWKYEWDTRTVMDGTYSIKVLAIYGDSTSEDLSKSIEVKNAVSSTTTSAETFESTTTDTTTPKVVIDETKLQESPLEPTISLSIPEASPLTKDADIFVYVAGAEFIEFYAQPIRSLTPIFIGLGVRKSEYEWRYRWYTTTVPNGEYVVFAKVRHKNGISQSSRLSVAVSNDFPTNTTKEEEEQIAVLKEASAQIAPPPDYRKTPVTVVSSTPSEPIAPKPTDVETFETFIQTNAIADDDATRIKSVVAAFTASIENMLKQYEHAERRGDIDESNKILQDLNELIDDALRGLTQDGETEFSERVSEYLERILKAETSRIARNERLIRERIGGAVNRDSDKDGVLDFDEINLYGTDPYSADTDNDGFTDGAEIERGFNPLSSVAESNVAYESPRDLGSVREDILMVDSISSIQKPINNEGTQRNDALITGKGLPNSFVTLYIFSTPIVVTVRTGRDGSWSYILDRELDDGEHDVYVGITDNAGRIVAKSERFTFVKTAQAYAPVGASVDSAVTQTPEEPSLLTMHALLIVSSIAVVALGLVLILLGIHVRLRRSDALALQ